MYCLTGFVLVGINKAERSFSIQAGGLPRVCCDAMSAAGGELSCCPVCDAFQKDFT